MSKRLRLVATLVALAGVLAVGTWLVLRTPGTVAGIKERLHVAQRALGGGDDSGASPTVASGFVEADLVQVSAEEGGRVVAVYADEGDGAAEGELLVQIDDSILRSRIEVARADLEVAEAQLAQVMAGAAPETIRRAQTEAAQARAARAAAQRAWQDALAMLANPQELELALVKVRGELEALGYQKAQAEALANAVQTTRTLADDTLRMLESMEPHDEWVLVGEYDLGQLPPEIPLPPNPRDGEYYLGKYKLVIHDGIVTVYVQVTVEVPAGLLEEARERQSAATYDSWTAWTAVDLAEASRQGAESLLAELTRQKDTPLPLQAQVHATEANYGIAAAAVELADSQVEGLEIGATPEQIAVVEAQVDVAAAALKALEVETDRYVARAPIAGLVLERTANVGEVVAAGSSLLTLANLEKLSVTAYVPEDQLASISTDQTAYVTVDAFPGRTFSGRVSRIASEAEFSPKNVLTQEERANLVFAVQVTVANQDGALKPGMPADVRFSPEAPAAAEDAATAQTAFGEAEAPAPGKDRTGSPLLTATGSIEGREATIVSEIAGRIDQILVEEGDEVDANQPVVELDTRSLSSQIAEARAAEAGARANLAQVRAGTHPAEILSAEAALAQAQAGCAAAESELRDVEAMLQDTQALNAQIVEAQASVAVAEAQVEEEESRVAAAEAERDRYRSQGSLEEKGMYAAWNYQVDAAQAAVDAAQAKVQASRDELGGLKAIRDHPLAVLSQVHAAQGRYEVACAGAAVARAKLDELKAGPRDEAVRVAVAQVAQAAAAVGLAETQAQLLSLRSPAAGVVTGRLVDPGEMAIPGAVLLRITDMDEVRLMAYVEVDRLGGVQVGQGVEVRVDAFPGAVFEGVVSRIAAETEFVPSNVQAAEDRAGMAVAVTVRVPNPGHKLRPGMPADVVFLRP